MECKKCGKKIGELEEYCDECKQLNDLIEKNKELNKLEITKEIDTLNNFNDEKSENNEYLKEELKDIVNIKEEEKINRKTLIIIISIIAIVLVLITIIILLVFKKDKEIVEEENIDYEIIINKYGDKVNLFVSEYLKENEEIPSWSIVKENIDYNEYKVVCEIHNIYKDGNVYLDSCKVNNEKVKYSYGKKIEEVEGKKINIYIDLENNIYTNIESNEQVGSITCNTEDCEFIYAYETYVIIKDNNKYYIYDYNKNTIEFGPFYLLNSNYENNVLTYNNKLYAVLYEEEGSKNIYSIQSEKTFKNIKGSLLESSISFDPKVIYKYGYLVFKEDDTNNFISLKSGNISYSINGTLNSFIESTDKNLVYITVYNSLTSKMTIYNSTGKKLFDGKEFNNIKFFDENIVASTTNNFYIYDYNLKLILTSNNYDNILGIYNDFIVVADDYLKLVNLEDKELATFDLKWDTKYTFNSMLSGKFKENDSDVIYLIVESNNNSYKYYYIPETKEFGLK